LYVTSQPFGVNKKQPPPPPLPPKPQPPPPQVYRIINAYYYSPYNMVPIGTTEINYALAVIATYVFLPKLTNRRVK